MATIVSSVSKAPRSGGAVGRGANLGLSLTIWSIWGFAAAGVASEILGQTLLFSAGFYSLHVVDIPVVLSILAAAFNLAARDRQLDFVTAIAGAIACLIAANLIRGLLINPAPALLTFRANGAVGSLLLMIAIAPPDRRILRAARNALVAAAAPLVGLEVLRLLFGPTLFMTFVIDPSMVNDGGRPLSVTGAFDMTFAMAILLSDLARAGRLRARWQDALALVLPFAILATQQGTASIAAFVVVISTLIVTRGPFHTERVFAALLILAAGGTYTLVHLARIDANDFIQHRLDNLGTRQMVWASLKRLWADLPIGTQIFGCFDGQPLHLFIWTNGAWRPWANSMHSMIYGSLPMMGYLGGALFFILVFATVIVCRPTVRPRIGLDVPAYPAVLCITILILSYSYEVRNEALLGLLIPLWWLRAIRLRQKVLTSA